jgi:hypothetical protein
VNDAIDRSSADVSDDRLKRRQVAVDIGDDASRTTLGSRKALAAVLLAATHLDRMRRTADVGVGCLAEGKRASRNPRNLGLWSARCRWSWARESRDLPDPLNRQEEESARADSERPRVLRVDAAADA